MKFTNALGMPGNEMLLGKQTFFPDASLGGGLKDYAFYTSPAFKDLISGQPMQTTLDAGRPLPDNSGNVAGLNEPVLGENGIYSYGPYTNLLKFSEGPYQNWIKGSNVALSNSTDVPLPKFQNSIKYNLVAPTSRQIYPSTISVNANGKTYTVSFWIKVLVDTSILFRSFSDNGFEGNSTLNIFQSEGWQRLSWTYTFTQDTTFIYFYIYDNSGNIGDRFLITGWQLTESPYALPYIKTEDSQVSVPINYSDANGGYKWPINSVDTPLLLDALDGKADGSLEDSGSLVSTNRYQVVTTETDHFGTGVIAGDRITGQTTALDANNTVKQISPAQGEMQVEWVPGFNYSDRSTGATACILSCHNNYRPLYLHYSVQKRIQIYDGTTPVYKDINFQAGTKYTINAVWGTHPTEGANKMQLFVTDGITNWQSNVVDFDGSFTPKDYLSIGWDNEYYQAIKSIKFYKETKSWS